MVYQGDDDIVRIKELKFAGTRIKPGMKFDVDYLTAKSRAQFSDWIEGVEFSISNNSSKRVTCVLLDLHFPDAEATGPDLAYRNPTLGVAPEGYFRTGREEPVTLEPGDSAVATIGHDHMERIRSLLQMRSFKINDMNRMGVGILGVFFDDGLMYASGHYYKRNPASPKGYERIVDK
jgi:hypothetical protein